MKAISLLKSGFVLCALVLSFQAAQAAPQADGPEARVVKKLKEADADGDGRLSRAEVARLPGLARLFDRIDANRDGSLTRSELRAARDTLRRFQEAHFDDLRDLESESHQARIQILQQADACIKGAATPEAYRQCERQEQSARESLRESMKSRREDLVAATRP